MHKDPLYFIAILPPEDIQKEVTAFKKYIADTWGPRHALRSPPHITLQPPFAWPDERLPELKACLEGFAKTQSGFDIHLKNFGAFPPRVIYVEPLPSLALEKIYLQMAQVLEEKLKLSDKSNTRPFSPHMTIAHRDVEADDFPEIWAYFKRQSYARTFLAAEISLLKLKDGKWEVTLRIPLK
jgi:2'-5' RNA ligase